jgi:hypothetical protein
MCWCFSKCFQSPGSDHGLLHDAAKSSCISNCMHTPWQGVGGWAPGSNYIKRSRSNVGDTYCSRMHRGQLYRSPEVKLW